MNPKLAAVALACVGQLLTFAAMALIARHYTQAQLAEYGVFMFLFAALQIVVTLRLEQGLVYQRTPEEVSALASAALLVLVPATCVGGALATLYLYLNPQTFPRVILLSALLVLSVLFGGAAKVLVQLLASQGRFFSLSLANVSRPSLIAISQICFLAVSAAGYFQLPLAFALSQILLTIAVYWIISSAGRPTLIHSLKRSLVAAKTNKEFACYNLPQNVVFVVSDAMLPLSLPFLFPGSDAVALFWLASRTVMAPATVLAESVRAMIYKTIAQMHRAMLLRYILLTSLVLMAVTLLPVLVLLAAGDYLFNTVYGPGWGAANAYAIILGCLVIANAAALPFVGVLPVLGLQGHYFGVECAGLATRAMLLYGVAWSSPLQATFYCTSAYILVLSCFLVLVACQMRKTNIVN